MRKYVFTLLFCLGQICLSAQELDKRKVSVFLSGQYSNTIRDITKGNNPWGLGSGLQAFLHSSRKFKPTLEITGDVYLYDDKVFRTMDGKELKDIPGVISVFAGGAFYPDNNIFASLQVGPSWINARTLFGIKPSVGLHFSKNKRWLTKASYTHIFKREEISKQEFTSISLSIGYRLF